MIRKFGYHAITAAVILWALGTPAGAQEADHIRGEITKVQASSIDVRTDQGEMVQLSVPDNLSVIRLDKSSITKVDHGTYVGSVAMRLDEYSPIVRDSSSWLHKGFELRVIAEELRGVAVGRQEWDLTPEAIMVHGWVDEIEGSVLSIKYGPTEEEEVDVDVGRDTPVLEMSLGDMSLIKPGVRIFAGAQKKGSDAYEAVFVFAGEDGVDPSM